MAGPPIACPDAVLVDQTGKGQVAGPLDGFRLADLVMGAELEDVIEQGFGRFLDDERQLGEVLGGMNRNDPIGLDQLLDE